MSIDSIKIEKILKLTHDSVIIFDENMIIKEWNESAETQFGIPRKNVLGKQLYKILPTFKEQFEINISTALLKERYRT